jgi:hypothetical protein
MSIYIRTDDLIFDTLNFFILMNANVLSGLSGGVLTSDLPSRDELKTLLNEVSTTIVNHAVKTLKSADNVTVMILLISIGSPRHIVELPPSTSTSMMTSAIASSKSVISSSSSSSRYDRSTLGNRLGESKSNATQANNNQHHSRSDVFDNVDFDDDENNNVGYGKKEESMNVYKSNNTLIFQPNRLQDQQDECKYREDRELGSCTSYKSMSKSSSVLANSSSSSSSSSSRSSSTTAAATSLLAKSPGAKAEDDMLDFLLDDSNF